MSETGMQFDRGKADWIGAVASPAAVSDLDLGLWLTSPRASAGLTAGLSAGRSDVIDAEELRARGVPHQRRGPVE
jgi:hypothetical protein